MSTWLNLNEDLRAEAKRKLDNKQEAFLIATASSTPPAGRMEWTMCNHWQIAWGDTLSDETVRRSLNK